MLSFLLFIFAEHFFICQFQIVTEEVYFPGWSFWKNNQSCMIGDDIVKSFLNCLPGRILPMDFGQLDLDNSAYSKSSSWQQKYASNNESSKLKWLPMLFWPHRLSYLCTEMSQLPHIDEMDRSFLLQRLITIYLHLTSIYCLFYHFYTSPCLFMGVSRLNLAFICMAWHFSHIIKKSHMMISIYQ